MIIKIEGLQFESALLVVYLLYLRGWGQCRVSGPEIPVTIRVVVVLLLSFSLFLGVAKNTNVDSLI